MFQVKVYNRTNTTLKKTISPKNILSDISFSMNLNGGLGEQTIELAYPITDTTFDFGDIVKITMFNDSNKSGKGIYMGYITKIQRKQTTTRQTITLVCLGMASLLTEQKASKSFNGATAGSVITGLIDDYNTNYGAVFNYSASSIDNGPTLGNGNVSGTYLEMLQSITTRAGFYIFIDGGGTVWFKPEPTTPTHYLTNKKDVEGIDIREDLEGVINSVNVQGEYTVCSGSPAVCHKNYVMGYAEDASSIAQYGKRQGKTQKIYTSSQDYANEYASQFIIDNVDPRKETTIIVNRDYNLESIVPGHTVKVKNFEYSFDNIKIIKISYTPDKVVLYLDRYISFGEEIIKS